LRRRPVKLHHSIHSFCAGEQLSYTTVVVVAVVVVN